MKIILKVMKVGEILNFLSKTEKANDPTVVLGSTGKMGRRVARELKPPGNEYISSQTEIQSIPVNHKNKSFNSTGNYSERQIQDTGFIIFRSFDSLN